MIKLTITPNTAPTEQSFSQDEIIIGFGEGEFHITLEEEGLQGPCVQIAADDGKATVDNLNPEIPSTVNGKPFDMQALDPGDILILGSTEIRFDGIELSQETETPAETKSAQDDDEETEAPAETEPTQDESEKEEADNQENNNGSDQEAEDLLAEIDDILDPVSSDEGIAISEDDLDAGDLDILNSLFKEVAEDENTSSEEDDFDLESFIQQAEMIDVEPEPDTIEDSQAEEEPQAEEEATTLPIEETPAADAIREDGTMSDEFVFADPFYDKQYAEKLVSPSHFSFQDFIQSQGASSTLSLKSESAEQEKDALFDDETEEYEITEDERLVFGGIDFDIEFGEDGSIIEQFVEQDLTGPKKTSRTKVIIKRLAFIAAASIICIGTLAYFVLSHMSNEFLLLEYKVGQGIADLGMAMIHTQVTQNTDRPTQRISPNSVASHLDAVLASPYREKCVVNITGTFSFKGYTLDIYTSKNLDNFVVIAEPVPSLWDLVLPKSVMIVDGEHFQVRRVKVPLPWSDLFANTKSLDEINPFSLSQLISQASVIPLEALNLAEPHNGFTVPKDLTDVAPGANNYIYSAPRYYKFSEFSLDLARQFKDNIHNAQADIDIEEQRFYLQRTMEKMYPYSNIILYSSKGKLSSLTAEYGTRAALPTTSLLFAYIKFEPTTKLIESAHLLTSKEFTQYIETNKLPKPVVEGESKSERVYFSGLQKITESGLDKDSHLSTLSKKIITKVKKLTKNRNTDLQEISTELHTLIKAEKSMPPEEFKQRKKELTDKYDAIQSIHKKLITNGLDLLYAESLTEFPNVNLPLLYELIKDDKLQSFLSHKLTLKYKASKSLDPNNLTHEELIRIILASDTLEQLDEALSSLSEVLRPEKMPDPVQLQSFKSTVRSETLQKLNNFLLSPKTTQLPINFYLKNDRLLNNILLNANITQRDEKNFYLKEFDNLVEADHNAPSAKDLNQMEELNKKLLVFSQLDEKLSQDNKKSIQEKYSDEIAKIADQKEALAAGKKAIATIPLSNLYTINPEERSQYLGRIGQQILIQASALPSNDFRNQQLHEAINLLIEATSSNRLLWGDILQANKLLSQAPEHKIRDIMESAIGFVRAEQPITIRMRALLKEYIDRKRQLTQIGNLEQYNAQYEFFRQTHTKQLNAIMDISQKITSINRDLQLQWKQYAEALEAFFKHYEQAKLQGYFVLDPNYQGIMFTRLKRKQRLVQNLMPTIVGLTDTMIQTSEKYHSLAVSEINALSQNAPVNSANIENLQKAWNNNTFPNLDSSGIANEIGNIASIDINPIP